MAAHDDVAAFGALAPRSIAAVGDLDNYRRGSGRFGAVYGRFAPPGGSVVADLRVTDELAVVTLQRPGQPAPASVAVPVRQVGGRWLVDPILDVGSYSLQPQDGETVGARPTLSLQLDDPTTRARVWFDRVEGVAPDPMTFRPSKPLSGGWHVVTVVLLRDRDVVARTLTLRVGDAG